MNNIDTYIAEFPESTQKLLQQIRQTIQKAAPTTFYPAPSGISAFQEELSKYKNAKGSVQFPLDQKLPLGLVTKITKFRVKENMTK